MFGSIGESALAGSRADYCSSNASAIQHDIGILDNLNNFGDSGAYTPGASATPQTSQAQADIDAWDAPVTPGTTDEDSITKLTLVKVVNNIDITGTATKADFTLTATCVPSADGKTGPCIGQTYSANGGFGATTVLEGTYTLTDTGIAPIGLGYTPSSWTCTTTGTGKPGRFYFLDGGAGSGTAMLSIEQGAQVSCTITNTK